MSNKHVTALLQTHDGYLWVGTENGLNRYDGYTFFEYNRQNGLSSGKINCLYEAKNGKLWIGTWQGLNILDQKTGEVKCLLQSVDRKTSNSANAIIRRIAERPDGSVIVVSDNGIGIRFIDESHYEKVFSIPEEKVNKTEVTEMKIAADASIYLITTFGRIIKFDKTFKQSTNFNVDMPEVITINTCDDGKTIVLVNIFGKVLKVSSENGEIKKWILPRTLNLPNDLLTAAYVSDDKFMWAGYSEGSFAYTDLNSNLLTNHTAETKNMITGATTVIYPDRNGVLWIGSNYGLIKFNPKGHNFENYLFAKGEVYKNKNSMRGMLEDDHGDIYAGGYNGLYRIGKNDTAIKHFVFDGFGKANYNAFFPYRLLDDDPYIWITSEVRGLYRFNKKTETLEFPLNNLDFFRGYALLKGPRNTIWVGTHKGLYIYNITKNTIKKYTQVNNGIDIRAIEITDLKYDLDSNLWIGSYSMGLFRLDKKLQNTSHFSEANTKKPLNFVSTLYFENDSMLWIGSREGGLGKMNIRTGQINFITKKDGLADNSVAAIIKDNGGVFWISTFNGLSRLDPLSGLIENYYDKDGLTESEFNISSFLKSQTGKLYFGGLNGINAFEPKDLKKKKDTKPVIFLSGFTKYDGSTDKLVERYGDLSDLKKIDLSYKDKFFSFSFALDDYYDPLRNTFFYRLEGYDAEWTKLGTQNSIRFNSLPAGKYHLQIRGINSEGNTSANELDFNIHVSSPFYNSWWFYVLVLLAAMLLVYSITRYRIYQKLKIANLRTKISSDLHDEVGSLLTRISIQAELIKRGISPNDTMAEIGKIADTSRLATAAMSDVLWSIDARNDKVGDLVDRLREQAGEILFPLEIEVDFKVLNIEYDKIIANVKRENLFLIFKEAINNIAKHAGASKVMVKLENDNNGFTMLISDNGVRKVAQSKPGQGLRNMKMRAERINGSLDIDQADGYTITLRTDTL